MYFSLTNSLATFHKMMNDIFQDLILSGDIMVYLDDILITHSDLARHREIVWEVLQQLREHHLFLHPEKFEFEKLTIEYLGVIILHNHVEMDPIKVAGVASWPEPKNKKDVEEFLGFTNCYRRFIQVFSDVARPLFDLMKKGVVSRAVTSHPFRTPSDPDDLRSRLYPTLLFCIRLCSIGSYYI
jgi:hypothetical protein